MGTVRKKKTLYIDADDDVFMTLGDIDDVIYITEGGYADIFKHEIIFPVRKLPSGFTIVIRQE